MTGDEERVRVIVVDDHAVVRKGLQAFFAVVPDIEVVGEAADGDEALTLLAARADASDLPDVVLMDLMMPGRDGTATTAEIRRRFPNVQVVAMTSFGEAERVQAVLRAGAAGYVLKDADADEVAVAVRAACRGEMHLDAAVARKLTHSLVAGDVGAAALTPREREVLLLVAAGRTNREIAEVLTISERTARAHVSGVLTKLGLTSRTQAAVWALREGLTIGDVGA